MQQRNGISSRREQGCQYASNPQGGSPRAGVLNYTGHFAGSRVTASRSLFLINVKCSCERSKQRTERGRQRGGRNRSSGDLRRRFSWSSRNVGSNTSSRAGKARSPPIRKPYQLPSCSFARSLPDRLSMHFSVGSLFHACRRSRQADSPRRSKFVRAACGGIP